MYIYTYILAVAVTWAPYHSFGLVRVYSGSQKFIYLERSKGAPYLPPPQVFTGIFESFDHRFIHCGAMVEGGLKPHLGLNSEQEKKAISKRKLGSS